jgi:hypothetical protein
LKAAYLPTQTDAGTKITELYTAISKKENTHPEAALLVAGDFNACILKSVLPHFYQHVKCATSGGGGEKKKEKNSRPPSLHTNSPSPSIWQI